MGTAPDSGLTAVVGVVVAAHDAEKYLAAAIHSVLDQTHTNWLCVVVDDGSHDTTSEVASSFVTRDERFSLLHQQNAGVSAARNAGLAALSPRVEYVCFLDSDDLLLPEALARLLVAIGGRPDAAGASGWADWIDAEGAALEPGRHRGLQARRPIGIGARTRLLGPEEDTSFESLLLHGSISPPATALVRRSIAEALGGFDTELACAEDADFWLRAARMAPLVFVDQQIAWYRRHEGNATAQSATCLRANYAVRKKAWRAITNTAQQRRAVLAASVRLQSWELLLALRRARRAVVQLRPLPFAWSLASAGIALGRLLALRPAVPSERWAVLTTAMNDRCGFDRSANW